MSLPNYPTGSPDRSGIRKKLATLLLVSLAAFSLTTWRLARVGVPARSFMEGKDRAGPAVEEKDGSSATPSGVVEAHLTALSEGRVRVAYGLFSARYRKEVSFEMYHDLIAYHQEMFETHELTFGRQEVTGDRATIETHTESEDGGHYVARFTLVRLGGRWWIDEVHWGEEDEGDERIQV